MQGVQVVLIITCKQTEDIRTWHYNIPQPKEGYLSVILVLLRYFRSLSDSCRYFYSDPKPDSIRSEKILTRVGFRIGLRGLLRRIVSEQEVGSETRHDGQSRCGGCSRRLIRWLLIGLRPERLFQQIDLRVSKANYQPRSRGG